MRLALDQFFDAIAGVRYAVVKTPPTPEYLTGSDVDVFCDSIAEAGRKILSVGNGYLKHGFEIEVATKLGHAHIDFWFPAPPVGKRLTFRFDLYDSLPAYKRVMLKPALFESILAGRVHGPLCYVASPVDDLLIRHIEYLEWYEQRPDKIRHLFHIQHELEKSPEWSKYLDKLHQYTGIP